MATFTALRDVEAWVAEYPDGVNHLRHAIAIGTFSEPNARMARSWLMRHEADLADRRDRAMRKLTWVGAIAAVVAAATGLIALFK